MMKGIFEIFFGENHMKTVQTAHVLNGDKARFCG
jgi:hypothetical protein